MQYHNNFQLDLSLSDLKVNISLDELFCKLTNRGLNIVSLFLSTEWSIYSDKPFTTKQVEFISEYFNIPPKIKNTLLQHPVATYILAKNSIEPDAKLVNHEFGTEGVNCWFDFYDEDGIEYRSHRCLTFESFELFQKHKLK
jgi:hypothetical protein